MIRTHNHKKDSYSSDWSMCWHIGLLEMRPWTKHLSTFLRFSRTSLHHKWNGTKLLSPENELEVVSQVAERLMILGNFTKIHKILGFDGEYLPGCPKSPKISSKTFTFYLILRICLIFSPKLWMETHTSEFVHYKLKIV